MPHNPMLSIYILKNANNKEYDLVDSCQVRYAPCQERTRYTANRADEQDNAEENAVGICTKQVFDHTAGERGVANTH